MPAEDVNLMPLDLQADGAPYADGEAPPPEKATSNLVARKGFPHQKVARLWNARIKFCEESDKENEKDYKEASAWFKGGDQETSGTSIDDRTTADSKFAGNIFYSDVNKLVSFLLHQDTKTACKPAKGPAMKPLAEATQALADIAAREQRFREQKKKAFIEAIFRNHGYVRQGWDHYNWLPTLTWPDGEVRLDPDCNGDIRRARFMIEEFTSTLDALMEDEEIPEDIRRELKEKREIHNATRAPEWSPNANERDRADKETQTWDSQPGFTKVVCYRIWSREGLLPGIWDDQDLLGDSITDAPVAGGRFAKGGAPTSGSRAPAVGTNPNVNYNEYRAPPELRDDASPEPPEFDPLEHGRRVYVLMVKEFHKVLKVTDWPMDHYRRDEFPYVEIRFADLPGDLHGVPIFRVIRPHLKAINKVFETWIADKRHGARRIIEAAGEFDESELSKLEKGSNWEVVRVQQVGQIKPLKFDVGDDSYTHLIPALMKLHDDASGVNDVLRGQSGDVQKTATEAAKLDDNAAAALGYLEDALENFDGDVARLTVSALQRYVPRESTYPGCPTCGEPLEDGKVGRGRGMVPNPEPYGFGLGIDAGPPPEEVPCPTCANGADPSSQPAPIPAPPQATPPAAGPGATPPTGPPSPMGSDGASLMPPMAAPPQPGHGWDPEALAAGNPIVKGADFWLPAEQATAWRDDLSIEQIRAEVVVGVKPGSSRRDYREREVARLRNAGQDLVPFYQAVGGSVGRKYHREYVAEVVDAVGISDPDRLVPTDADMQQAAQEQQAAAAAQAAQKNGPPAQAGPPGPSQPPPPDPQKMAELDLKRADGQSRHDLGHRKLDLEQQRLQMEQAPHAAAADGMQQAMGVLTQSVQQVMAMIAQAITGMAQAVQAIQAGAQQGQAESAAQAQAAVQAIQASAQQVQALGAASAEATNAMRQGSDAGAVALARAAEAMEASASSWKAFDVERDESGKIRRVVEVPSAAPGG